MLVIGGLFATSSLITTDNISTIKKTWDSFEESRSEKAAALSALRKEIGYGGMIHQFKQKGGGKMVSCFSDGIVFTLFQAVRLIRVDQPRHAGRRPGN